MFACSKLLMKEFFAFLGYKMATLHGDDNEHDANDDDLTECLKLPINEKSVMNSFQGPV